MTHDELRQAAERIVTMSNRQLCEYEQEDHDDPDMLDIIRGHMAVARAYLSTPHLTPEQWLFVADHLCLIMPVVQQPEGRTIADEIRKVYP